MSASQSGSSSSNDDARSGVAPFPRADAILAHAVNQWERTRSHQHDASGAFATLTTMGDATRYALSSGALVLRCGRFCLEMPTPREYDELMRAVRAAAAGGSAPLDERAHIACGTLDIDSGAHSLALIELFVRAAQRALRVHWHWPTRALVAVRRDAAALVRYHVYFVDLPLLDAGVLRAAVRLANAELGDARVAPDTGALHQRHLRVHGTARRPLSADGVYTLVLGLCADGAAMRRQELRATESLLSVRLHAAAVHELLRSADYPRARTHYAAQALAADDGERASSVHPDFVAACVEWVERTAEEAANECRESLLLQPHERECVAAAPPLRQQTTRVLVHGADWLLCEQRLGATNTESPRRFRVLGRAARADAGGFVVYRWRLELALDSDAALGDIVSLPRSAVCGATDAFLVDVGGDATRTRVQRAYRALCCDSVPGALWPLRCARELGAALAPLRAPTLLAPSQARLQALYERAPFTRLCDTPLEAFVYADGFAVDVGGVTHALLDALDDGEACAHERLAAAFAASAGARRVDPRAAAAPYAELAAGLAACAPGAEPFDRSGVSEETVALTAAQCRTAGEEEDALPSLPRGAAHVPPAPRDADCVLRAVVAPCGTGKTHFVHEAALRELRSAARDRDLECSPRQALAAASGARKCAKARELARAGALSAELCAAVLDGAADYRDVKAARSTAAPPEPRRESFALACCVNSLPLMIGADDAFCAATATFDELRKTLSVIFAAPSDGAEAFAAPREREQKRVDAQVAMLRAASAAARHARLAQFLDADYDALCRLYVAALLVDKQRRGADDLVARWRAGAGGGALERVHVQHVALEDTLRRHVELYGDEAQFADAVAADVVARCRVAVFCASRKFAVETLVPKCVGAVPALLLIEGVDENAETKELSFAAVSADGTRCRVSAADAESGRVDLMLVLTAYSSDALKRTVARLAASGALFRCVRVFFYTSTLDVGVSIERVAFDRVYAALDWHLPLRDVLQAARRARELTDTAPRDWHVRLLVPRRMATAARNRTPRMLSVGAVLEQCAHGDAAMVARSERLPRALATTADSHWAAVARVARAVDAEARRTQLAELAHWLHDCGAHVRCVPPPDAASKRTAAVSAAERAAKKRRRAEALALSASDSSAAQLDKMGRVQRLLLGGATGGSSGAALRALCERLAHSVPFMEYCHRRDTEGELHRWFLYFGERGGGGGGGDGAQALPRASAAALAEMRLGRLALQLCGAEGLLRDDAPVELRVDWTQRGALPRNAAETLDARQFFALLERHGGRVSGPTSRVLLAPPGAAATPSLASRYGQCVYEPPPDADNAATVQLAQTRFLRKLVCRCFGADLVQPGNFFVSPVAVRRRLWLLHHYCAAREWTHLLRRDDATALAALAAQHDPWDIES